MGDVKVCITGTDEGNGVAGLSGGGIITEGIVDGGGNANDEGVMNGGGTANDPGAMNGGGNANDEGSGGINESKCGTDGIKFCV
jgi:hypothetical protein